MVGWVFVPQQEIRSNRSPWYFRRKWKILRPQCVGATPKRCDFLSRSRVFQWWKFDDTADRVWDRSPAHSIPLVVRFLPVSRVSIVSVTSAMNLLSDVGLGVPPPDLVVCCQRVMSSSPPLFQNENFHGLLYRNTESKGLIRFNWINSSMAEAESLLPMLFIFVELEGTVQ